MFLLLLLPLLFGVLRSEQNKESHIGNRINILFVNFLLAPFLPLCLPSFNYISSSRSSSSEYNNGSGRSSAKKTDKQKTVNSIDTFLILHSSSSSLSPLCLVLQQSRVVLSSSSRRFLHLLPLLLPLQLCQWQTDFTVHKRRAEQ